MPQNIPANLLVETLAARTLDLLDEGVQTPILLIDGRSASGKTTLAAALQQVLFKQGETLPRVVHMDDLYEGWHGLQAGHDLLLRSVLLPVAARRRANWQEWDWALEQRNQWREFDGGTPLIVEGCGSLSRQTAELAHLSAWLEVPEQERQRRWIQRTGHDHDEWWPIWAAQELDFYAKENSVELAQLISIED